MKRIIFVTVVLGLTFSMSKIKAQEKEIRAKIDFIIVTIDYNTYPDFLSCDTSCCYFNPLVISFGFEITNNSDKEYFLFGSNTIGYFRDNNTIYAEDDIIGKFYLVNENDSILLFSRGYYGNLSTKKLHCTAGIDYMESFRNEEYAAFLCKFKHQDEFTSRQKIFNYLKKSKVIYLPFTKDYENIINKYYPNKKDKIVYPNLVVAMEMPNPLYVFFGDSDDDSELKILGEKDFIYKSSNLPQ